MTRRMAGSFVCVADSSGIFYAVCVRIRGRERGLSLLLTGCSLTCRDYQKGLEK